MLCPYCGTEELKVVDSRDSKDGENIKRRRECLSCNKRFSTIEKILKLDLEVQKSSGEIEEFNIQKIKKSLLKCCDKRPITLEQIDIITQQVISDLKKERGRVISSTHIGNSVMCQLFSVDKIAFLKYAIVHHNYNSLDEFTTYLEKLKEYPTHMEEFQNEIFTHLQKKNSAQEDEKIS
ncbi:MAG: transcriptional regulator NrdR [Candidatus Nanoarchaeia archaeon]